ncbi:nucleotidyl transferase AbiEii/AbiGii toxin family protein [soil metagenome]
MRPVLDILPASQLSFWNEEKNIPAHFVLYGGTALALRLGHRQSLDFDFFSSTPFTMEQLAASVPFVREGEMLQSEPNTLTLRLDRGGPVTISFFGGLSFGQLAAPDLVKPPGLKIASSMDLMATKLRTVFQRSEAKDYMDIAALLRSGISLREGLSGAITLFGPQFNPALPLKALTYFGDGDLDRVPAATRDFLVAAVKETHEFPSVPLHARVIGAMMPDSDAGNGEESGTTPVDPAKFKDLG